MTKAERDAAILKVAEVTQNLMTGVSRDYALAEVKKYSSVREYVDKTNGTEYVYTAYGTPKGRETGYYGLRTKSNTWITGAEAKEIYHKSKTWYK